MPTPAALATARFWADYLRAGNAPLNNGSVDPMLSMLTVLAQSSARAIDPAAIDAFEAALAEAIDAKFAEHTHYTNAGVEVGVDYGPDFTLSAAAEKANVCLTMTSLPWKSYTRTKPNVVTAKVGYGAPAATIWEKA